jgi:hypothetical protein
MKSALKKSLTKQIIDKKIKNQMRSGDRTPEETHPHSMSPKELEKSIEEEFEASKQAPQVMLNQNVNLHVKDGCRLYEQDPTIKKKGDNRRSDMKFFTENDPSMRLTK